MTKKLKILFAYDGSPFADAAIDDLTRAGLPSSVDAVVMSITDAWELPEIVDSVTDSRGKVSLANTELIKNHLQHVIAETTVMAESAAARISELFPNWEVKTEAMTGKPAWEILKYSDIWEPDLIVMGSHGRGFVGRAILGSVSMKVLHESRCSVRISRGRKSTEDKPLRIMVAVDGSENSYRCVETVAGRSWPKNVEFRIATADDDPSSRPETHLLDAVPEGKEDSAEAKAWVERVLSHPLRQMEAAGLNVTQSCRWGDARRIILDDAEDWKADCIFIGARGLSRFRRLLIGSVSSTVAARADCSVEVLRVPEPEA